MQKNVTNTKETKEAKPSANYVSRNAEREKRLLEGLDESGNVIVQQPPRGQLPFHLQEALKANPDAAEYHRLQCKWNSAEAEKMTRTERQKLLAQLKAAYKAFAKDALAL